MARNPLETVGDAAQLLYGNTGTLALNGAACGTLTGGTLTGAFGDGIISNQTLSQLCGVYDITPNEVEVPEVEITKLGHIAGVTQPGSAPDWGEVSAMIPYDPGIVASMNSWISNRTIQFWGISVDDYTTTDSVESFLGWIKKMTPVGGDLKKKEPNKMKVTIKITGKALFTAGT